MQNNMPKDINFGSSNRLFCLQESAFDCPETVWRDWRSYMALYYDYGSYPDRYTKRLLCNVVCIRVLTRSTLEVLHKHLNSEDDSDSFPHNILSVEHETGMVRLVVEGSGQRNCTVSTMQDSNHVGIDYILDIVYIGSIQLAKID